MSEQRKWGVHNCPNGLYYLTDSIDGLYIGTGGYIWDYDKEGILSICELLNEKESIISALKEENEQLHHELQQIKEYLQTKIDECKNHKKMKEIVFGVEQAVGYEKALLQFQKGLKRRLNENVVELFDTSGD